LTDFQNSFFNDILLKEIYLDEDRNFVINKCHGHLD
jgi:hypothetical protein